MKTPRMTRSRSNQAAPTLLANVPTAAVDISNAHVPDPTAFSIPRLPHSTSPIKILSSDLTRHQTSLSQKEHALLLRKQTLLRSVAGALTADEPPPLARAISSTLVYAAHHAGTAVCVSPEGLLLTAAHCIAEDPDELAEAKRKGSWLLFADGIVVKAIPLKWDVKRDIALLQIVAAQRSSSRSPPPVMVSPPIFPYCPISTVPPRVNQPLLCIGHPGSEDLEAPPSKSGQLKATGYDVLCVTRGRFRGLAKGQDPQDNSEIGALKHDCWTYWGHSGAPLVSDYQGAIGRANSSNNATISTHEGVGELVGLHSSWDEETGMRRGVALVAILSLLHEWKIEIESNSWDGKCRIFMQSRTCINPSSFSQCYRQSDWPICVPFFTAITA